VSPRIAASVLVVDGYGISLTVERGHLLIRDGVADQRQERRISRVETVISRLIILADTGTISLDAVRWCADLGIVLLQIDRQGGTLFTAIPPGRSDARLRRAQARAVDQATGLAISRSLLQAKLQGQAEEAHTRLNNPDVAGSITNLKAQLDTVHSVHDVRSLEATAASTYFGAWTEDVATRFAPRAHGRVPEHWHRFGGRRPPRATASSFTAIDPINAMLNYLYRLAEIESRRACLVMGLDPGLGFIHTDKLSRDSLALDLLETVRPHVDAWLLDLLTVRTLQPAEFHETRTGACRILEPLTHELATTMPLWAEAVAPHAEAVAHTLAEQSPTAIRTSTPLTGTRKRAAAQVATVSATARSRKSPAAKRTCRECGTPLPSWKKICGPCWSATRPATAARDGYTAAQQALAAARAAGDDPTHTPEARARRAASFADTKQANLAWERQHPDASTDTETFRRNVLPGLADVRLSTLMRATGLTQSACSVIRAGKHTPHPRHWAALAEAGTSQARVATKG